MDENEKEAAYWKGFNHGYWLGVALGIVSVLVVEKLYGTCLFGVC